MHDSAQFGLTWFNTGCFHSVIATYWRNSCRFRILDTCCIEGNLNGHARKGSAFVKCQQLQQASGKLHYAPLGMTLLFLKSLECDFEGLVLVQTSHIFRSKSVVVTT